MAIFKHKNFELMSTTCVKLLIVSLNLCRPNSVPRTGDSVLIFNPLLKTIQLLYYIHS